MTTLIKRLTIDLSKEEHMRIKVASSVLGVSMKDFLLRSAFANPHKGKSKAMTETEYLLKSPNKEKLLKALRSKESKKFASLRELKNAI